MNILVIDMGRDDTLFCWFRRDRKGLAFMGGNRAATPTEETFAAAVDEAAALERPERVILSLCPSLLFHREVSIPIPDRKKLRQVLPLELKGETVVDTDDLVFDALSAEDGRSLAVWVRKRDVASRLPLLKERGLEPQVVTVAALHWNWLLPESTGDVHTVITDGTAFTMLEGKRLSYFRALPEADEIGRTVAALELTREVRLPVVYLAGKPLSAEVPGHDVRSIPLPPEVLESFRDDEASAREGAGAWAAATADAAGDIVNFRHGDLAYTSHLEAERRKLRVSALLAALVVVLLFADLGIRWYLTNRDLNSLNQSIGTQYRQIFPTRKKPVDEVSEVKSELKKLSGAAASSDVLGVLKKLAEVKGDDVAGFFETEVEGQQVRLKGDAKSFQAVTDLKNRMATSFRDVETGEVKSKPDGGVTFSLRAVVKEAK